MDRIPLTDGQRTTTGGEDHLTPLGSSHKTQLTLSSLKPRIRTEILSESAGKGRDCSPPADVERTRKRSLISPSEFLPIPEFDSSNLSMNLQVPQISIESTASLRNSALFRNSSKSNLSEKNAAAASSTLHSKDSLLNSNPKSPVLRGKEFHPHIAQELEHEMRHDSASEYYKKMFDLIARKGPQWTNLIDLPLQEQIFKGLKNIDIEVSPQPEEVLVQLLVLREATWFHHHLTNFFLPTFEYYVSPLKLLVLLVQFFLVHSPVQTSVSESALLKKRVGSELAQRVIKMLEAWIMNRENDFLLGESTMFEITASFGKYLKQLKLPKSVEGSAISVIQLVSYLKSKMKSIHLSLSKNSQQQFFSCCPNISSTQTMASGSPNLKPKLKSCRLLFQQADAEDLARIFLYIDLRYYNKFSAYDMFSKRIEGIRHGKTVSSLSCPLQEYLQRFNSILNLLIFLVLTQETVSDRASMLHKYVKMMAFLSDSSRQVDLEAVYQLALVLNHICIKSMTSTSALLGYLLTSEEKAIIEQFGVLELNKLHQENKQLLSSKLTVPAVPCTSIFIQIIGMNNARRGSFSSSNGINLSKMAFISSNLNSFFLLKKSEPNLAFMKQFETLEQDRLFQFLDGAYIPLIARELDLDCADPPQIEKKLLAMAKAIL
jgi:hypothetical protein